MQLTLTIFGMIALYGIVVTWANRNVMLPTRTFDFHDASHNGERMPETVSVSTWNVGYGGLGAASDFVIDGGRQILPPSRAVVTKNVMQIAKEAGQLGANIKFFQEVAHAGPLSRWQSVVAPLARAVGSPIFWWRPDVATRLLPWPVRLRHGTVIATDLMATKGVQLPIVGEPKPLFGFLNRQYGMQIMQMPGADDGSTWTFINIHLSAFDDGGNLRRQQIDAVIGHAQGLYKDGHHVVIGGDWNMRLIATSFAHQTTDKDLFWIHDFPQESIPPGWNLAIDTSLPTVRTNHQPFVRGENYMTIIDGFIASPNVEVVDVATTDTGFEMSDHMPVTGRFRAKH